MAIIIETCPKCGHDLHDVVLASNPPIPKKECFNCGWHWEGEPEQVIRVPFGGNSFNCDDLFEKAQEYLREQSLQVVDEPIPSVGLTFPSCCDECSNNPKNGGSGICNCTLPYMQNPTTYTTLGESCMANNIDGRVYFSTSTDDLASHEANADRIAEAVERTKRYVR